MRKLCTLTEVDIAAAEDVVKALNPLKAATLVMSEDSTPTLSVIAPLHAQLLEDMRLTQIAMIKELKSVVHDNLSSIYLSEIKMVIHNCG